MEVMEMVVMSCPWCEEEVGPEFLAATDEYRCDSCGTSVLVAVAEEDALDLAA
jgi:DNA-directed RNA polymerase subunit RPC12/RpoP